MAFRQWEIRNILFPCLLLEEISATLERKEERKKGWSRREKKSRKKEKKERERDGLKEGGEGNDLFPALTHATEPGGQQPASSCGHWPGTVTQKRSKMRAQLRRVTNRSRNVYVLVEQGTATHTPHLYS